MEGAVPVATLLKAGVKRVSMGVALYARVMADLKVAAKQLADGDTAKSSEGLAFNEAVTLIKSIG
jgi:2-methylisocitrate lyase-like PEP mutase family enzyme